MARTLAQLSAALGRTVNNMRLGRCLPSVGPVLPLTAGTSLLVSFSRALTTEYYPSVTVSVLSLPGHGCSWESNGANRACKVAGFVCACRHLQNMANDYCHHLWLSSYKNHLMNAPPRGHLVSLQLSFCPEWKVAVLQTSDRKHHSSLLLVTLHGFLSQSKHEVSFDLVSFLLLSL